MAFDDDGGGDVAEFAAVVLGVVAQHLEGAVGGRGVARHQDPFRLFDQRATDECACVVEDGRLRKRIADPRGCRQLERDLAQWLN